MGSEKNYSLNFKKAKKVSVLETFSSNEKNPRNWNSQKEVPKKAAYGMSLLNYVPFVPTCLRALRALNYYMPTCLNLLRAYVP